MLSFFSIYNTNNIRAIEVLRIDYLGSKSASDYQMIHSLTKHFQIPPTPEMEKKMLNEIFHFSSRMIQRSLERYRKAIRRMREEGQS